MRKSLITIFCKNNSLLFSRVFLLQDYFRVPFILLDNSIFSCLLGIGMYDTDLKRLTIELAYGINVDNGKSDCTKPIGIRQAAMLLEVWNQSLIVTWRQ